MIFPWINYLEVYKELSMNNEPPTLYSLMQSIVNFNRDANSQIPIKDLAKYSRTTIFDFDYPISNKFGKEAFEVMFLNHYMFRRINYDTLRSFQLHLMVKLNDIMPKYNKMIEGFSVLDFDGTKEIHTRVQNDSRNTNTNESQNSKSNVNASSTDSSINDNRYSDTPQGDLEAVQDGTYLTDYTYNKVDASNTNASNSNSESTNNKVTNDSGLINESIEIKKADTLDEYKKYMEIINNIYSMIFKECDSLFYGII